MNIVRFHPGYYIRELLECTEMTVEELSIKTEIDKETLCEIINETKDITYEIAYKLSIYFDNSIYFWINLQNNYNKELRRETL